MCPLSSKPTPLTTQLPVSFPPHVPMVKSAWSLAICERSLRPSWITTPMIRSYSLFLKLFACGDIIWRAPAAHPIDIVTDHKNLMYFSTSKVLSQRQARWSEYLSQFNLVIRFQPSRLGAKPDALTRRWDVYSKKGENGFTRVNPQNLCPVFTTEQLNSSLRVTYLQLPVLWASVLMDVKRLHADILSALPSNPTAQTHLSDSLNPWWTTDANGFLCLDGRIYVPEADDLRLCVLRYKHDHPLSGHFSQSCTLELVRRNYTWPGIRKYVKDYIKSCTTCTRAKTPCHRPYRLLKQLLIPERPWDSISMDFIEQLPSSLGFTAILIVIDQLSKQAIFVPTYNTIMSPQLTQLFFLHIFSKHGVPSCVTSDRGTEHQRFHENLTKHYKGLSEIKLP